MFIISYNEFVCSCLCIQIVLNVTKSLSCNYGNKLNYIYPKNNESRLHSILSLEYIIAYFYILEGCECLFLLLLFFCVKLVG